MPYIGHKSQDWQTWSGLLGPVEQMPVVQCVLAHQWTDIFD
jgi:hypothetical protein